MTSLTKKEALKAAKNLKKKTGLDWSVDQSGAGGFSLRHQSVIKGNRDTFISKFRKSKIEFQPSKVHTTLRGQKDGYVSNDVLFSDPNVIKVMAEGKFKPPKLSTETLAKAADNLCKITGLDWTVLDNEICTQVTMKASGWEQAQEKFQSLIDNSGLTISPGIMARSPAPLRAEGKAVVAAFFLDPFKIDEISKLPTFDNVTDMKLVSQDEAKRIYEAVSALGKESQLNGLSNTHAPDKFQKALSILGIDSKNVEFNGTNGYKVELNPQNEAKMLREIDKDIALQASPKMR